MRKLRMIFIAIFLVNLVPPTFMETALKTYSFEAVLPKEQLIDVGRRLTEKARMLIDGSRHFYAFNIIGINSTTQTISFNATWSQTYVDQFGDPVDLDKLAEIVYGYMFNYGFTSIRFRMHAPPAPPIFLKAIDVKRDSITFTWQRPKYFDVDFYEVEISSGSRNASWENVTTVDGNKESMRLENLKQETMYHIRMDSSNSYGRGEIKSKILMVETKGDTGDDGTSTVIIIIVVLVIITILMIGILYYWRRRRRLLLAHKENPYENSLLGVCSLNIYVHENRTFCTTGNTVDSKEEEYFSWNEISRDYLTMGDVLGEGEFGLVLKAIWRDKQMKSDIAVAIKTVKDIATNDDRKELFKELQLMADLAKHPNVVNLVGACSHGGPLWVVVEFCENGNLLSYIKKNRRDIIGNEHPFISSLGALTRLKFAYEVSKGMSYLEDEKIVHRDLAARNVLLGENEIAKVSDFGLSRDIYESGLYERSNGGKLPVKWMAIESLQESTYTSKSDVWSFGVMFWEIETAGIVPYPGISGLDLSLHLHRGYRLPKPPVTSPDIYKLMMKPCWELNPEERPSFKDLKAMLASYMEQNLDYLEVVNEEDSENARNSGAYVNYVKPTENESN